MRKFLRKINPQSKVFNSIYIENDRIYPDNTETGLGDRYWIAPIIALSDADSLKLVLDDKYSNITYLGFFIDRLPLPALFYNSGANYSFINDIQASSVKIYFHQDALFRQPFDILNITASYENQSYPVSNIYDKQPSTYYLNDSGSFQTITIETLNTDALQYLTVYYEYSNNLPFVDISKIEVSSDGTNWLNLTFSSVFNYAYTDDVKRIQTYGNFNSYPLNTKFIRITIPNNAKINKICLHRKNNDYLFNDKFYIRTLNNQNEMFIASSTSNLYRPSIYPYPVPKNKNYITGTALNYEETFDISNLPNDTIFKPPQMKIKTRKKPVFFNIDRIGIVKDGLNATRNAIFYPAYRIEFNSYIETFNQILDLKEVIIPNRGLVKVDSNFSGFIDLAGNTSTSLNGWQDGFIGFDFLSGSYIEKSSNLQIGSISTGKYLIPESHGIIGEPNKRPITKIFRSKCSINGDVFYPGDVATIYPGEYVEFNHIENFSVLSFRFRYSPISLRGNRTVKIYYENLKNISRQSIDSEFVSLETDETPYRLEIEYPETSLRIMVTVDGTNWYGIDRTNNNFQRYTTINDNILSTNGLTLDELNELLPSLVLDTSYNRQLKFIFYLPYMNAEYKSLSIWLKTFKGQYVKQIYSFDNGSTWYRYNGLTRSFEQINFTDDTDAFRQATFVYNLPIDRIPSGTTNLKIKYLFVSNYDFDLPEILSTTRYETAQPKIITRKIMEGNSYHKITEYFDIIDYKYAGGFYLDRDNVYVISKDTYSKKDVFKVYVFRGGIGQSMRLENILGKDLGINDNQKIEAYLYLSSRSDAKPQKISLAGIDILETGVVQGNNTAPFNAIKDLRTLKKITMSRSGQNVFLTFTWTDNTIQNLQLTNYQQGINNVKINFYSNFPFVDFEILTRNLIFENNYDIVNEYPFDITLLTRFNASMNIPIEPSWFSDIYVKTKFIISVDGNNWYSLINNTPTLISNPNDINEIKQKGMTELDYYHYGIENWLSFFNITDTSKIIKIRNDRKPLSFIPFKEFDNSLNEYIAMSRYDMQIFTKDKFII